MQVLEKIRFYIFVVCLFFSTCYCQGQNEEWDGSLPVERLTLVTDSMVTMTSWIDNSLFRWNENNDNWQTRYDSIYLHTQQKLDTAVSFLKNDSNYSYIITKHVTSFWKSVKPGYAYKRSKLFKNYLVWRGVDSTSIWLSIDTIPNCEPLEYSEECLHYYEIKKVQNRYYSGWIKEGRKKCLPHAYLYGIVKDNWRPYKQMIGRSDSTGWFECSIPNVPMTIVVQDENHQDLAQFKLGKGEQIDKRISIKPRQR